MRILIVVAVIAAAAPLAAQTPAPQPPAAAAPAPGALSLQQYTGQIDFGVRLTSIAGDPARYQRFRDLRSGPTFDRFRYVRDRDAWAFTTQFDHVGYRDQRFAAAVDRFGKLRASFEWNQIPIFYANPATTPYRDEGDGVFRLDNSIQAAVQNRTATTASYAVDLQSFELRARRDVAAARFTYSATPQLDLHANFTSTNKHGGQQWGAPFGFSNAIDLPVPLELRTNDVSTAAEWSNARGMARLAYDGSWLNNGVEALTWDNPLRLTDQTTATAYSAGDGSAQGRMALWPDSTAHAVSASGSLALPARTRAFAYVSLGNWRQDEELLPFTVNSAIAPIPLPRDSAEAEARITSMTYRVTSRPTSTLWVSGQYRLYDFDNRTPHFPVANYVRLDGTVAPSATGGSEPFGYQRQFIDLDASLTPFRLVAFRLGYGEQHDDRTYRFFDQTTDRTVRASIDTIGLAWGSVRLQYDRSDRRGDGFDEQAFSDIGEQVSLRQFDIANRTRDRLSVIFQVMPFDTLGINGSVAAGQEGRPDSAFGLQDNDLRALAVGIDYVPDERLTAGLSYSFENYGTQQQSRQANPGAQFNDPTRDWWTDMDENMHTLSLNIGLPRLTSRTAATLGYDYVGSRARYAYRLAPNTTLAPVSQLPPVRNVFHVARIDVRHTLTRELALGVGYRYDGYDVDDFALSPGTLNSPLLPAFMNLVSTWRPYDASSGVVRLIYSW